MKQNRRFAELGSRREISHGETGGRLVTHADASRLRVAVLIPCYNEAVAIERVVSDFKRVLPHAIIYVYDNNSQDNTADIAGKAGAVTRKEMRQGKGFVVRRMFADIDADVYVMIDGDDTYDAASAPEMLDVLLHDGLDMVNGAREDTEEVAFRQGHKLGNRLLSGIVRLVFGDEFRDMLSGFRVFSRRFVKSFPAMSAGFEIETELTIHALELQMPTTEVLTRFKERPSGSSSKLRTVRDGLRILWTIALLLKQERPLTVFSVGGFSLGVLSVILTYPIILTYMETGLVPRFPTAILATGIMLLAFLSFFSGLILNTVTRGRQEAKRMKYLSEPGVHAVLER